VHLVSLGCAKNQVDSEKMLGALVQAGALICEDPRDADTVVINTCGFIASAKEESVNTILAAAKLKDEGTCQRLIVAGCLVARHPDELAVELPEVDAFTGVGDAEAVVRACGLRPRGCARLRFGLPHVAFLRIADGCDNRCAYCAIPLIRGSLRSEPPRAVVAEASRLAGQGAREIIIIAQDTTSYGRDRKDGASLARLLPRLAAVTGKAWLRLMYTHPAHFSDDLISAYQDLPTLCRYVDVPLQHLSDPILKRMGRRVTQKQCLDLIDKLRARVPGLVLRTTFLVGFPGETASQFNELLRLVERIEFDHLGAFTYSVEEGTAAARLPRRVSQKEKDRRYAELMAAQQEIAARRNAARMGQRCMLLVDSPAPGRKGAFISRFYGQAPDVDGVTLLRAANAKPGRFFDAVITAAQGYDLVARPWKR